MSPFTADAAAALPGPPWLQVLRTSAAERAAGTAFPTEAEEIWRYSRISDLDLEAYTLVDSATPVGASADAIAAAVAGTKTTIPERAGLVMVVDGQMVHHEVDPALAEQGLRVTNADAPGSMGAIMNEAPDVYAELNTAFATAPVVIEVPDGLAIGVPVVVAHFTATEGLLTMPRVVVRLGTDSELTVLDHHSSADVRALTLPVAELDAGPGARLRYLAVNLLGPRVWQIASQVARAGASSSTLVANVALGGDYARVRTDARLDGKGAAGDQLAAYFGEGDQMHDFRTLQDHAAPKTTSDLLFKGAVEGRARSVYSGLIRVRKEAPGTSAFQTNRNLKLSDAAWADSVPNLEIDTNDVRCSHASTVGPIDAEQRFYVESRGVRPERAEELIVNGFFSEVLERLPVKAMIEPLRAQVAAKLAWEARGMTLERLCTVQDLPSGQARLFVLGDTPICVVRIVDRIFAIGDTCSHANISLSEGEVLVDECEIECWKHGSSFSLETGEPLTLPATQPVPTYPVRIDDGDVYVEVEL